MEIEAGLRIAKDAVRKSEADPRVGWAWSDPVYRASSGRAFQGPSGALTIEDDGLTALEEVVSKLLRDQRARTRWREGDLWAAVLSLLVSMQMNDALDLKSAVKDLVNPAKAQTIAALANVTWGAEPAMLGSLTIAHLQGERDAESLASLLNLDTEEYGTFVSHSKKLLEDLGPHAVAINSSARQGELGYEDLECALDDLIGLTLMLSENLDEHGLYSLRGATNRPGVRGITLDRKVLGDLLEDSRPGEFAAQVLTVNGWDTNGSLRWYSPDPMPLDRILDVRLSSVVGDFMSADDAIARRIRVSGRWYARAFWASSEEDAALAVGVALDSLLTGNDALPGAVSKSRFALLERDVALRADRFERYEQVYRVRSTVAHGGDAARQLAKIGGARSMLSDAQWAATQLIELRKVSAPKGDAAFRELWGAVQWGSLPWTSQG